MCSDTIAMISITTAANHALTTCILLENTATANNARSRTVLREAGLPAIASQNAQSSAHQCEWERHIYLCDLDHISSDNLGSYDGECHRDDDRGFVLQN